MNKIYKVIWSNAKNCYVVVSELAKSRVKAVSLCKILVAASIFASVVSDNNVLARDYAEEKEAVSVEEGIINNGETAVEDGNTDEEEKDIEQINKTMVSNLKSVAGETKPGDTHSDAEIARGDIHREEDIAIGENSSVNRVMQDVTGNGDWREDTSAGGVAVGANASVMGGGGTAVGQSSKTIGIHSLAVGSHAETFGVNSISIGASASVGSEDSDTAGGISVGTNASVTGQHGIAIGSFSNTSGPAAVSIGQMSNAAGSNAIAIGTLSKVEADAPDPDDGKTYVTEGIAIGSNAYTSGFHGVALGASARSTGKYSVASGQSSQARGDYSTSLGAYSVASGMYSIASGYKSEANEYESIAIGYISNSSGSGSIAVGAESSVTADWSTAIGNTSVANYEQSVAVGGFKAIAGSKYSTALGSWSNVTGESATALGYNSKASYEYSVALGSNSETAGAIGTSEFTLKKYQNLDGKEEEVDFIIGGFAGSNPLATVSVGKEGQYRTITNVAAGRVTKDSTDAINGSQLFAVADGLQNQINDINKKIDNSSDNSYGDDHYHTVNGNDKEDKTDVSNNTDITNNNQDNNVTENVDDINTPASGNSGGTNTDPVGDKPTLGGDYVGGEDGNLLIKHDTDSNGKEYYDISLNQDLNINSMNVNNVYVNEEIKVGDDITINKDNGITVGDVNINKNEIKVGDKVTINDNSVNVGDVTINEDNINMGGNKIINVAEGTEGTDAVNVNQLNKLEQNVNNKINRLDGKIDKVGAGAAALAALHPLDFDPDDKLNFSAGVGNYHGSTAAAIGAFYQPNDDTLFSIGGTVGNGDEMVNVGVSFRFGQHSNQSRSKKAMAKEIIELRTEIAELKAMMYSLTGQGFDPYKSKIFPDTPENHWAYDYVAVVAGNGILEGYPSGRFDGRREMTRYEMAAVIYRLMTKGIQVDDRMLKEFAPELARVKVDTLTHHEDGTPSIQRVRIIEGRG